MKLFVIILTFGTHLFANDLFEFGRQSSEATQRFDKTSAENFRVLGQHDLNKENFQQFLAQFKTNHQQRLRSWIQNARNLLYKDLQSANAVNFLNQIKFSIENGLILIRSVPTNELNEAQLKLKNHLVQAEIRWGKSVQKRNDFLTKTTELLESAENSLKHQTDHLSKLSQNQDLHQLGPVQINNSSDFKRFYIAIQNKKHEILNREATLIHLKNQLKQLDTESPWYLENLEDLKSQITFLETSL